MRPFSLLVALVGIIAGLAAAAPAQAQTTVHGAIKWGGYAEVPSRNSRRQRVPTFAEARVVFEDQVGWYTMRLPAATAQGELLNLTYEPFAPADAKLFDAARLPAGPEPRLNTGTEMKLPVTYLSVRPARRNPQTGQPERLVAFDYRYQPGAARTTAGAAHVYGGSSVLASGDWFKIGVAESGVYKLDKATLSKMGLNVAGLNPNNFHLYGNSMGILPQPNATKRPDDLTENNILFVNSNNDNVLDDNEYFLFYSPGAHTWEAKGGIFQHRNNIYTDTAYYFVGGNSRPGLRVPTVAALPATGAATINTFTYRAFHEHDLANLLHSGREWVGEGFRVGGKQDFTFSGIPDLVAGAPVRVYAAVLGISAAPSNSTFQFALNGAALGGVVLDPHPTYDYSAVATLGNSTLQTALASPGSELKVGITFVSPDATASGYLDYLDLNAERQLRLSGAQLEFRTLANIAPGARSRYVLAGTTATTQVWDVTNPRQPQAQPLDGSGAFVAPADTLREFVALERGGAFAVPRAFGKVASQNLHAINLDGRLDLVIVAPPVFRAQAQRLADHRAQHDNLRAVVVTTTEVYNEYASGGQDVTAIRDFMKQVYQRTSKPHLQLLLFGDASFDYKSDPYNNKDFEPAWWRDRVPFKSDADFDKANQNYVPTYESRESLTAFGYPTSSYSSDDYYALLDDNEGEWSETTPGTELLDVGVGRLPVRQPKGELTNTEQARAMVDKVKSYDAAPAFGKWRNRITLVSDDGNDDLFVGAGSELITDIIHTNHPVYNVHKVYLDLYPQLAVAAGQRSPAANQAIDQSIEQGSLIVNYLGHGGPKGWADEQIVSNASVLALRNSNNLTFFTTGTCDFSTYDNPDFTSAGEQVLTDNTAGGAIGLFTTTRVVNASDNTELNKAYFNRVLQPLANGQFPTIGTAVMMSLNDYPGPGNAGVINNRNYTLLADPSMTLAYPRQTVLLDSLRRRDPKGNWVTADTLLALSRVRLHAKVLNGGALSTGFTGRAQVTIYDKPTTVMTLGDELPNYPGDGPRPVDVQESIIYGGQAEVVNGQFSLSFVVPKDINYSVGVGKISLYAADAGHGTDANGYQLPKVGGAYKGAPSDTKPPEISLFMDSEQFAFGGLTAQNTTLLAKLTDESGINTTGAGIGHDITAILDHDPTKLLTLNDTYVANVGDFTTGRVNNPYKTLAAGPHSLTLKAWDTYNNSAERTIEFVVAHDEKLALDHVLNYPNPFAHHTTFFFEHNQAGAEPDNLDVQVQIFTVAGHLVRTLNSSVATTDGYSRSLSWDGRDDFDDPLARGVYVYRLTVRSQRTQTVASKYEKLVILN
ncbi:MAG: type IX secretion system sortase PorU [Bacteroidota bacterium]|nr:type IX secretion system sortase PorU [Bacteroidota bacterium]